MDEDERRDGSREPDCNEFWACCFKYFRWHEPEWLTGPLVLALRCFDKEVGPPD